MVMFGFVFLVVYGGVALGTYEKIVQSGLRRKGESRFSIYLIPLRILVHHMALAIVRVKTNPKEAYELLKWATIWYPQSLNVLLAERRKKQ